jgi:hypothetical protein
MNTDNKTKLSIWLFNPFVYVAGAKALIIGCGARFWWPDFLES